MAFFNYATMQMAAKIVYYGPGLCGKTTNLQYIYRKTQPKSRGEMVSLETETDRTLFFDLLPLEVGNIGGFKTRFQLYTVPGQVFYNDTRKLVLKGVDGIVYVADSQSVMMDANLESLQNLKENLEEIGVDIATVPLVLQYNKRDLPTAAELPELEKALNWHGWTTVEASALTGQGVFETLKAISKLTLQSLRAKITGEEEPKRAPAPVARPVSAPARPTPAAPSSAAPPPPPPPPPPPTPDFGAADGGALLKAGGLDVSLPAPPPPPPPTFGTVELPGSGEASSDKAALESARGLEIEQPVPPPPPLTVDAPRDDVQFDVETPGTDPGAKAEPAVAPKKVKASGLTGVNAALSALQSFSTAGAKKDRKSGAKDLDGLLGSVLGASTKPASDKVPQFEAPVDLPWPNLDEVQEVTVDVSVRGKRGQHHMSNEVLTIIAGDLKLDGDDAEFRVRFRLRKQRL